MQSMHSLPFPLARFQSVGIIDTLSFNPDAFCFPIDKISHQRGGLLGVGNLRGRFALSKRVIYGTFCSAPFCVLFKGVGRWLGWEEIPRFSHMNFVRRI